MSDLVMTSGGPLGLPSTEGTTMNHRAKVQYVPYIGTDLLRPGEKMERDMQAGKWAGWWVAGWKMG